MNKLLNRGFKALSAMATPNSTLLQRQWLKIMTLAAMSATLAGDNTESSKPNEQVASAQHELVEKKSQHEQAIPVQHELVEAEEPPQAVLDAMERSEDGILMPPIDLQKSYLMYVLNDPKVMSLFLKTHIACEFHKNGLEYIVDFRKPWHQLLADETGDCNDFAEAWCHVAAANGRPTKLLGVWNHERKLITSWDELKKISWHVVAVWDGPIVDGKPTVCIGDNTNFREYKTIEEFFEERNWEYLPLAGDKAYQHREVESGAQKMVSQLLDSKLHLEVLAPELRAAIECTNPIPTIINTVVGQLKKRWIK